MAVEAGADLVLISHQISLQIEGIEAVSEAVRQGRLSEARIDESVERLLRLKEKRGLFTQPSTSAVTIREVIGTEANIAVARTLSEKSITLVRDDGRLPLMREVPTYIVWPDMRPVSEMAESIGQETTLGKALTGQVAEFKEQVVGVEPSEEEIDRVLTDSQGYTQVVVATYKATFSAGQQRIVTELARRNGIHLTVVSLSNPYDLNSFPEVKSYLACYENKPLAIRSLAKVLMGEHPACGVLPVTVGPYVYKK
jgi:beta-N-acetylhexosaminidase